MSVADKMGECEGSCGKVTRDSVAIAVPLSATSGKVRFFLLLLAACAVIFCLVTLTYWVNGRSLVWDTDGRLLYFPFLVEEGEWLRGIVSSVLEGSPAVPVYSFDYGFGADWLVSASGNTNELFNLLAAFCPPQFSEYLYEALIFLRLYLAAATFSLYCFSRGKDKPEVFCGATCYILCGYVLFWGVFRHPNFIDFAILLPLVFMGADRLFARKGPVLLVVSMGLLFSFSIYFSYMTCLFLLFYCLISYFINPRSRSVGDFAVLVAKFIACLLTAFMLAGFSSFPMFISLTSMGRVGVQRDIPFLQEPDFYLDFVGQLLGNHIGPNAVVLGAVPVLCMAALVAGGRCFGKFDRIGWGIGVALCLIGALISKVGSIMNGFGYPTDRWLVILGFCASYVVVLAIPAVCTFGRRQWRRLTVVVALVSLWGVVGAASSRTVLSIAVVAMFLAVYAGLVILAARAHAFRGDDDEGVGSGRARRCSVIGVTMLLSVAAVANVSVQANIFASSLGSSYARQFIPAGQVYETREQLDLTSVVEEAGDAYRIDRSDITLGRNASFFHGYKGVDSYTSFYNQAVDDFRYSLGLADDVKSTMMNGVQRRTALDMLLGAKYFIASKSTADLVPVGYERVADLGKAHNGREYFLYECENVLPLAFVYDSAISQTTYDRLDMVQKQEMMTKSVVLAVDDVEEKEQPLATERSDVGVLEESGASVRNKSIVVTKSGGSVVFQVNGAPESECYLCFKDMVFEPASEEAAREVLEYGSIEPLEEASDEGVSSVWVDVSSSSGSHSFEMVTSASAKYAGKDDWAINVGYSSEAIDRIEVSFGRTGVYSFDEIYAAFQPIQSIEDNIRALRDGNAATVSFGTNSMDVHVDEALRDGSAADDGARYVFVSIPYSSGWSASLDGEPVDILRANVGFMAVEVDSGEHELRFSYVTPGMVPGLVCSLLACGGIVVFSLIRSRSRKR